MGEGRSFSLEFAGKIPWAAKESEVICVMLLDLTHTKFRVYLCAGEIVVECYQLSIKLPSDEKFGLCSQIKRAALSVKLNIAEGASRRTVAERKRFYEISRSSLAELDAAFDICIALEFLKKSDLDHLIRLVNNCYAMLSKMISS